MIFSNNMEYDDSSIRPTQGAYYSSVSTDKLHLNYFREEETSIFKHISEIDKDNELKILLDNNLISIKEQSELKQTFLQINQLIEFVHHYCQKIDSLFY